MDTEQKRAASFFRIRVAVLLSVLGFVVLWALRDVRSRRERNAWERSLSVALVLVRHGPLDDDATLAFRDRIPALDSRLTEEFRRYHHSQLHPFVFTLIGPVDARDDPPVAAGDGWIDSAREALSLWRWTSAIDSAAGLSPGEYDSRVYVVARTPESAQKRVASGESQDGGRIGTVQVELDTDMADFALIVTAHELFHTLGAQDKYGADGATLVPQGLAEPERVPLYPQRYVEVMARSRPVGPGIERTPDRLAELAVGSATAREIGWREAE